MTLDQARPEFPDSTHRCHQAPSSLRALFVPVRDPRCDSPCAAAGSPARAGSLGSSPGPPAAETFRHFTARASPPSRAPRPLLRLCPPGPTPPSGRTLRLLRDGTPDTVPPAGAHPGAASPRCRRPASPARPPRRHRPRLTVRQQLSEGRGRGRAAARRLLHAGRCRERASLPGGGARR